MEFLRLNNGIKMPMVGIGTFLLTAEQAENSVCEALKVGYRMIDTANAYMNERGVGRGIQRSGVRREDIFVVTKLWPTQYENADKQIDETIARLDCDYIDMLLLHQPIGNYNVAYSAMERAYKSQKLRSVGLSNFPIERIKDIIANNEMPPQLVQVETHPYYQQNELKEFLEIFDMALMAWYPLGHGDRSLVNQEIISRLAEKYHKSNQQIILRWHIQRKNIIIPGSKDPSHIRSNIDLFDFRLSDSEMNEINLLDCNKRYYNMSLSDAEKAYMSLDLDFNDQP